MQFSIPQRSTNVAGRKSVETMTVNVNMDRESILKDEDVFDVKTVRQSSSVQPFLLVKITGYPM